ncbi:MAG TPA: FCD domain-containing protein [Streptosporangiaceae bacterium]|nr:FCD domain-containing protein [Streptosporangiaceae bacterium]
MAGQPAERGLDLAQLIVAHSLRIGLGADGRLPTERQLARDLGVTRSSIRYALGILEAQGQVSREVGRGTYLRSPAGQAGRDGMDSPAGATAAAQKADARAAFAPADVMLVRRLLEPPAMPLAVAWATAADFAEMDRCLARGDRAASYEEFETWDLALHRSMVAATHSPLLMTLYSSIETARHGHIWGDLKRRSASAERRNQYQADHHEIVAALKARDAAAAVQAMRNHLARVSDHLNATDPAAGTWP